MPLNNNSSLKTTIDGFDNLKNVVNSNRIALRNKLENKNVSVYADEKLSSLINKVDNLGNIDIITSEELPTTVKNNQIVVISNTPLNKVYFTNNAETINLNENDIVFTYLDSDKEKFTAYVSEFNNTSILFKLDKTHIYKASELVEVDSYLGVNGEWVQIQLQGLELLNGGEWNEDVLGAIKFNKWGQYGNWTTELKDDGIVFNVSSYGNPGMSILCEPSKYIDITNYSTFEVVLECTTWSSTPNSNGNGTLEFKVAVKNKSAAQVAKFTATQLDSFLGTRKINIDISKLSGSHNFEIFGNAFMIASSAIKIKSMTLKEV